MPTPRSDALFARATRVLPGGVNSPVRAFNSVGGTPRYVVSATGCLLTDADGNELVDYVGSWGPMIAGHAHPAVVAAVREQAGVGSSFGTCSPGEVELAEEVCRRVPAVEMVRMTSSGTEAVLSVIRLARAATGRRKLVKFAGCYHGHADALLVKAGSGVATLGLPDSPGVPASATADTLLAPFNDAAAVEALLRANPGEVAAVLVEPVAGNMGLVAPADGFLQSLRALCSEHGALLVFDEVMTGFRLSPGGAQVLYGVRPDLSCFGKVIGGGLPVGAYGGRSDLMKLVAPAGPVYQAGTLSGNPLAMAAGLATLSLLDDAAYARLEALSGRLERGFARRGRRRGVRAAGGVDADGLFWGARRAELRRRAGGGPRAVRAVLPRDAGARPPPAAQRVRGVVRLDGARRGDDRPHGRRGARGGGGERGGASVARVFNPCSRRSRCRRRRVENTG